MLGYFMILFATSHGQFVQVSPQSPTHLTTDPDAHPSPRRGSAMWCLGSDQYVFGGDSGDGTGRMRDVWKFEASTKRWIWEPDGPGPVGRSDAATWTLNGVFWVYGGYGDTRYVFDDLWMYTPTDRIWHPKTIGEGPGKIFSPITWVNLQFNELFLYNTAQRGDNSTIWSYEIATSTWTQLPSHIHIDTGSQFCQIGDQVYVFTVSGIFYLIDIPSLEWSLLNTGPPTRSGGSLFPNPNKDAIILFGGYQGALIYRDVWSFSLASGDWTEITEQTRPSARWGASTCATETAVFLFGGGTNDLWRFGIKKDFDDVISSIQFNLDSATLSAFWAALTSTLSMLMLSVLFIIMCVRKIKRIRQSRQYALSGQTTDHDDVAMI